MPERSQGRRLGRYLVQRRLGSGGFARVYLALDPDLEFEVALKVLKAEFADDPVAVERFRREAAMAVRLRHPNVVTVLSVGRLEEEFDGSPEGAPYLVMDFLPDSLASCLAATPVLPEAEVRRVGADVARGLAYAHQAGVVHRDVKPDNILFGHDGQAVVTDFGIARAVADTLAPATRGAVVGTPSYFSPEQARGLPLDGRTDVYALGVTLFQAATGTLPFTGDDWYAVMRQHVEDTPPRPRDRNPALSPELDAIIVRALAKEPGERFAGAAQLADALAASGRGPLPLPLLEARDNHATLVVDPYEVERAVRSPLPTAGATSGRRWLVGGLVAGGLLAATGLALVVRQVAVDRVGPLPGPSGDSSVGGSITAIPPNGVFTTPIDILTDSALQRPQPAGLAITAPPEAELRLNGVLAGHGTYTTDSLRPGRVVVRASIPTLPGCPSSDTSATVDLVGGERRPLRLRPRPCGTLNVVATPSPINFTIAAVGGTFRREGRLPLTEPLVLPEGTYRLTVGPAPLCVDFGGQVVVRAGRADLRTVRLVCG